MRDRRPTRRPAALLAGVIAPALLALLVPAAIAEAREPAGGQDRPDLSAAVWEFASARPMG